MLKNIIWYKVMLVLIPILAISWIVYQQSCSMTLGLLTPIVLVFLWMVVGLVSVKLTSRDFLEFIEIYGTSMEQHQGEYVQDYMFFREEPNSVSISALNEGIYLFRTLICSALIPWSNIKTISFFTHKGIFLARLHVKNGNYSDRSLCIPWKKEFDELIPDGVVVINN